MYADPDLEQAQRILLARLDGLRAAYLIDTRSSYCVDSSFEVTHGSIGRDQVALGVSAAVTVFDLQPIASLIGSMDALAIRWDDRTFGRNAAVVSSITDNVHAFVLADDKIGDICFHLLRSEEPSIGARKHLERGVRRYLADSYMQPRTFTSDGTAISRSPDATPNDIVMIHDLDLDIRQQVASAIRSRLPECVLAGLLIDPDECNVARTFIPMLSLLPAPEPTVLEIAGSLCRTSDLLSNVLTTSFVSSDSITTMLVSGTAGDVLFHRSQGSWIVVVAKESKNQQGKLLYWTRHCLSDLAIRITGDSEPWKVVSAWDGEKSLMAAMTRVTTGIQGTFTLLLGDSEEKLLWDAPAIYLASANSEILGTPDIATTVVDLAEDLGRVFETESCSVVHVLIEFTEGCAVITRLAPDLIVVAAARDQLLPRPCRNGTRSRRTTPNPRDKAGRGEGQRTRRAIRIRREFRCLRQDLRQRVQGVLQTLDNPVLMAVNPAPERLSFPAGLAPDAWILWGRTPRIGNWVLAPDSWCSGAVAGEDCGI